MGRLLPRSDRSRAMAAGFPRRPQSQPPWKARLSNKRENRDYAWKDQVCVLASNW